METKDILIGVVIGAVLVWIFLGRQSQTTVQSRQFYEINQIQNRIQQLEYQLYKQQYQQYQPYQQHQQPILPATPTVGSYKNNEKWIITRSRSGHIDSLEIVRDAKINK